MDVPLEQTEPSFSDDVRQELSSLFSEQPLAVLSTHHYGQPHCSLVAFAHTDDLRELFFATTRATRKYANISADARVAMLIDNRSNREADFHEAMAVCAIGTASEIPERHKTECLAIFLAKHPHLRDFVLSPTCAMLSIKVERYSVVSHFQSVSEIHARG